MKKIGILTAMVVACHLCAVAQNGVYVVTNTGELASTNAVRTMTGGEATFTVGNEAEEQSGMAPGELDTTALREVLQEWLAERFSVDEMEAIGGDVPHRVVVGDKAIATLGRQGDTLGLYPVERRWFSAELKRWCLECRGGLRAWLENSAGDAWVMRLDDGPALVLRREE